MLVGEEVYCYTELKKVFEKKGNPDGTRIFMTRETIIVTEIVRKGVVAWQSGGTSARNLTR
ncbi:hypothetical protein J2S00_003651 [Caldalkalibacillus uzonensis]|uniref:Uncharacterized protein n=1 Tax=Caldalkalibacillus uzonensis TaxID=353224 RepID=A0ABU0CWL9_9BACI|nr:hypothetical protein [Caldalkalibacillus uzonensis]